VFLRIKLKNFLKILYREKQIKNNHYFKGYMKMKKLVVIMFLKIIKKEFDNDVSLAV